MIENTEIIINNGFIEIFTKLVEKIKYKDQGDIMRYGIDLYSNLASHPDAVNNKNTSLMLQHGSIDVILK